MHLFLTIVLQLAPIALSQYCNRSYALEYSDIDCVFYYNYKDTNCTDFNFQQCNWIECVHWKKVGNDTVCDRTQIFYDQNWNFCTRQCCGTSDSYPYSYEAFEQCQANLNEQHKLAIIIISSICGGLVLIGLIWCVCKEVAGKCDLGDCMQTCFGVLCFCCCLCLKGVKKVDHHNKHHRHHDHHHHHGLNATLTE